MISRNKFSTIYFMHFFFFGKVQVIEASDLLCFMISYVGETTQQALSQFLLYLKFNA